jgi:hypothetical protein
MKIKDPTKEVILAYEKKNEEIIDDFLLKKLDIRDTIKELNKNLGHTLIMLSDHTLTPKEIK